MDEIREILCKKFEYDVIAITESWLSPDISVDSTDLHIDNYTFYRKDRFNANKQRWRRGRVCHKQYIMFAACRLSN